MLSESSFRRNIIIIRVHKSRKTSNRDIQYPWTKNASRVLECQCWKNSKSMNLTKLATGTYELVISSNTGSNSTRIVKIKASSIQKNIDYTI